ncbi:MAG: HPr family phosphocarrier protein [Clostridia bacterium]|nr:HPr family phosphocarrier protein [Clostridia bacterium]
MQIKDVNVVNQVGLRSRRVASIFVAKANSFDCEVSIRVNERQINGKSLLGLLSGQIIGGMTITLITNGSDEEAAMEAITELIESGFEGC